MVGDFEVSHFGEEVMEFVGIGVSEFDEFESVCACDIGVIDFGFGSVVRKGSHHWIISFWCLRDFRALHARISLPGPRVFWTT